MSSVCAEHLTGMWQKYLYKQPFYEMRADLILSQYLRLSM